MELNNPDLGGERWEIVMITKKVICPVERKRGFPTELDARLSLLRIKDDQEREKIPIRVYQCEHCSRWHTTSRSQYEAARKSSEKATTHIVAPFKAIYKAAIQKHTKNQEGGSDRRE
jgi:hypothetical protein